jgi:hypothetical protein
VRIRPYFWPRRRVRTRSRGNGRAKTGVGLLVEVHFSYDGGLDADVLKRSEEKFIAQSICNTKRELNTEQDPSSVDQLSGM